LLGVLRQLIDGLRRQLQIVVEVHEPRHRYLRPSINFGLSR
jgi:hypothetical protein